MEPLAFAPFALLIAIGFFYFGRAYEGRKIARESNAAERIRAKYQAHISSPARTSKD